MVPRVQTEHVTSLELDLRGIPECTVRDGEEIELRVVGFNFTVNLFQRVPERVDSPDGARPTPAYILVYQYCASDDGSTCIHSVQFVGGKPIIFFLYEDTSCRNCTIKEYRLVIRNRRPTLILEHRDAERDPERSQPAR